MRIISSLKKKYEDICDDVIFSDTYCKKNIGKEISQQVIEELNSIRDHYVSTIANVIAGIT